MMSTARRDLPRLTDSEFVRLWTNPRGGFGVNPLRPNEAGASLEELRNAQCAGTCRCWRHRIVAATDFALWEAE
jgi:hypothetical protein